MTNDVGTASKRLEAIEAPIEQIGNTMLPRVVGVAALRTHH